MLDLYGFIPAGVIKMKWLSEYFHANYPDPRSLSN